MSSCFSHEADPLLDMKQQNKDSPVSRRGFLGHTATGLSSIALLERLHAQGLLAANNAASADSVEPSRPLAARRPHYTARAKNVLVIFCAGGCSHLDTFDYKPALERYHGKQLPGTGKLITFQGENGNVVRSPWTFRRRGAVGKMTSDLFPFLGELVDDLCFLHGMTSKVNSHGPGETFMSTGFNVDGFPSMGSWVTYALGTENEDLPAFVAIPDSRGRPQGGVNNWSAGFLPAVFQGNTLGITQPVRYLRPPAEITPARDVAARRFLQQLNERHLRLYAADSELAARITSYELAGRMQLSVPRLTDLSKEPAHVLKMYGADDTQNKNKALFARNCILARRMLESGVRFVQLFNGAYPMGEGVGNWDGHKILEKQYNVHGPIFDQPCAALLRDLKQRGLLEETVVLWCTEFGRMPTFQKGVYGRDHNAKGFTCWLTGAGVRPGVSYGSTDAFGYKAVENSTSVHDLHATILHLLGLDHESLTFYHNGAERRLTDVHGHVIDDILV